jgi:hypothetical protein
MSYVYSDQLYAGAIGDGVNLFTVPAGYLYIVRSMELAVGGGAAGQTIGIVVEGPGIGANIVVGTGTVEPNQAIHWEGRLVMLAGQTMVAYCAGQGGTAVVSGYSFATASS